MRQYVAAWALGLGLLAACSQPAPPPPAQSRIVVLGFDGLDPLLTEAWMDDGTLPQLARLRQEGQYRRLATTNPPQSPVAWSDFATGTHAGQHGIFDFLRRDPATYRPDFSIAEYVPPDSHLSGFGWRLPLGDGVTRNRRQGEPFWLRAALRGQRATVLRVPVTFPPDDVQRMLSGMGVPDLLGTQGTYTLYTTQTLAGAENGGRVVRVRMSETGRIETTLEGPAHPLRPEDPALSLPLSLDVGRDRASVTLGEQTRELAVGEWSDWWPLRFDFGLGSVPGMVRLRLLAGTPRPRLYVSPIQVDPQEPAIPVSAPPDFAPALAQAIGRYHTLGMPEETWSLNQGHLDEEGFLAMVRTTLAEGEAMLYDALARNDSEYVVKVFVQPDRVSHMFWRGIDPLHPLHADASALARSAIRDIYRESDRIVGEVRARLGPRDRLVVLSDHGFAPFRRAVHLNRWLIDHGFLALQPGAPNSEPLFAQVDWSRSRAYALGLNGVFLNLAGREGQGIVTQAERAELLQALRDGLLGMRDVDGSAMVRSVHDADVLYAGPMRGDAPDLVVGYAPGFRASWQTSLGGAPAALAEDNLQPWSGDHCIDPESVPGVLFTSFDAQDAPPSITDMATFLLDLASH